MKISQASLIEFLPKSYTILILLWGGLYEPELDLGMEKQWRLRCHEWGF